MPSSYLHEELARRVRSVFPSAWPITLEAVACMGAQGPDLLFGDRLFSLHKPLFAVQPQGGMMHRTHTAAFLLALAQAPENGDSAYRAFVSGFFVHYAVDTILHPFVYAQSEADSIRHLRLEKQMDRWLYGMNGYRGVPRLYRSVAEARSAWPMIASGWAAAMSQVYGKQALSKEELLRAFSDMCRIARMTYSPWGGKYAFAWLLERIACRPGVLTVQMAPRRIPRTDFLNLQNTLWYSPWQPETERNQSVPQLMRESVERAVTLLQGVQACWRNAATWDTLQGLLGNQSYLTGLPCEENERGGKKMYIGVLVILNDDVETQIAQVKAYGLQSCQLNSWNMELYTPEMAERVQKACAMHDVRISTLWAGWSGPKVWNFIEGPTTLGFLPEAYRKQRIADMKKGSDFAAMVGIRQVATHAGFIPEDPNSTSYPGMMDALREIAQYMKARDQYLLFETGQETPVTLLRAFEDLGCDNLGINLDPANLILYGKANPVDALDIIGKYVMDVHAKDGVYPTTGRELGHERALGEGQVDFPRLIGKLHAIGYQGALTIEREITGEQQRKDIMHAKALLEKLI